jgi:hypothetical protein
VDDSDDSEAFEHIINGKTYYITNEIDGAIYDIDESGDINNEVGKFINGIATFSSP